MLALGIGGATAMFSVVRAVLLRPLPYERPNELVWMFGSFRQADSAAVSPPDFLDYRARNTVFASLGAMVIGPQSVTVMQPGGPERLTAATVSAGLITTLGVPLTLGRDFRRDEELKAAAQPVIISDRLWREQFHGARDVLGQTLHVDERVRTIVGVSAPRFALPFDPFIRLTDPVDLYVPLAFDDAEAQVRRFHFLRLIGRLEPGVSIGQAQSGMDVIAHQLEAAYPENATWKLRLLPLHERLVGDLRRVLFALLGAVLVLLLVACSNVAGLLLARGVLRQPEIALRAALGASRVRIVGHLLVEAGALALLGGIAGLLLGSWLVQVLKVVGPADLPRLSEIGIDPVVVAFALLLGGATSLVFGVVPALQATSSDPSRSLRDGVRTVGTRTRTRLRNGLVLAQVALSCTLLVSAGLLVRSLTRLQSVDPGFDSRGVVLAGVSLPSGSYASEEAAGLWFNALLERLSAMPGVEAAGLGSAPPLIGANDTLVHRPERPPASEQDRRFAQLRYIDGDYFPALRIPVLAGRAFTRADRLGAAPVVIVNRRMAEEFFPGERAIGRHLVIDRGTPLSAEVVGVVGDARIFGQQTQAPATMYLSSRQMPSPAAHVVLRMAGDPSGAGMLLRAAVQSVDRNVAVGRTQTLDGLLAGSLAQPRFRAILIACFAAVALTLTLGGLYGTLAWVVAQRTQEFGIRIALGAAPRELLRMMLGEGARMIAPGAVVGLAGGLAAGELFRDFLYEVEPFEPAVLLAVAAGLAALGMLAIIGPATRAAGIDPADALRTH
jgi:putative ABC transport system permease protein